MPVLFALLLGVIDYGLWFNDSISVRQGVREAARKAAVQSSFGSFKDPVTGTACTASGMDGVACGAGAMSVSTGGTPYARVIVASASGTVYAQTGTLDYRGNGAGIYDDSLIVVGDLEFSGNNGLLQVAYTSANNAPVTVTTDLSLTQ